MNDFYEQLIDLEQSLLKYASHLRLDNSDAKDLVQETYLKAILNRDKFVNTGYLKAWAITIMKNTFINNYRHNLMHNNYYDRIDESSFINQIKSSGSDDPDAVYTVGEINKCIERLRDKFRVPFKMYIAGYRYREIADTFNLRIGTVKSRIFLARKILMTQLTT